MEDNNTIIELNNNIDENTIENTVLEENQLKIEKRKKPRKPFLWNRMSKKGKIIILITVGLLLIAVILLCVYFFVINKDKKEATVEETVVLEKDNYIYENGVLNFLNADGKKIGSYKCKEKDPKKCYVAKLSNEDTFDLPIYVDKKGKPIERTSKIYNDEYVFVYDNQLINLYNIKDRKIVDEFTLIKTGDIDEDFVVFKDKEDKYGIISFEVGMETVIENDFEYLGIFNKNDAFVAKDDNGYFLIGSDGNKLSNYFDDTIKSFDDKYIAVYDSNYQLYSYSGERLLNSSFDFIDFNSSYIFIIKDGKMYVYDSELTKLNSGIKIKSTNYQKKYIFDEKNNLSDTKKAYSINVNANGTITIEDTSTKITKTISVFESVLSNKYDYVSYLGGVLYFYSDKEKTVQIGSYKCNNQNKVDASSEEFDNCFIAKEKQIVNDVTSDNYIPIFNDNYVFINDSKEGSNNIVLYDLKNSSQKAKYQEIDSGLGNKEITYITNVNSLIFARNTEGNYGVISFKNGSPIGVISFKENGNGTSKLSYLDNYLIATRGSVNYLYTKTGELLASSKFKIQEYQDGYLVVKDKNVLVYKMNTSESGTIISNEFDYVKLYDDFFIGIKDKKLNVYLYDDAKKPALASSLDIILTNLAESYKITVYSDSYVISIMQSKDASIDYKYTRNWGIINEE